MTIPVMDFQLHHERANTSEYSDSDHRVHHEVCEHTRFFDKDFPALTKGTCLDCGGTIRLGTWELVEDEPHLVDAELASERIRYNLFHRGFEVIQTEDATPDTVT